MATFFEELKEQRWDDHRFYHHSRINQSLHLVSACSFLVTYVLLFTHPVIAALFGWTFAMSIRQVGHFFFEPKGYDEDEPGDARVQGSRSRSATTCAAR